ncbi:MAG: hypothetical protein CL521_02260 [Actinobacteria bacterium]|nr:hypothetical protein [Actinomycetota bacterium]|tara:strand:+ start:111 stop:1202 length:1092 start_codon:yes stop_codon:yes gene_type:complete
MKIIQGLMLMLLLLFNGTSHILAETLENEPLSLLTLKGDFRLRYQSEKNSEGVHRIRNRSRIRLGGLRVLCSQSKVKFGLATGGADPRSTNQTFQDSFQTPDIRLDYAFFSHAFSSRMEVFGGKMKNPLWRPSDLLWDSDINPEGLGIRVYHQARQIKYAITGGYFVLDELKSSAKDPYLLVIQPRADWMLGDSLQGRVALGLYLSRYLKGVSLDHSADTNSGASSGLENEFSSMVYSAQVDFKGRWGVPLMRAFGEMVINNHLQRDHQGLIVGVQVGDQKVNRIGKWQSKVSYRRLEADAWLDTFPDSDSYGGATNVAGLEWGLNYGFSDTMVLGIDYYSMDKIEGEKDPQVLVQVDLNVKF